MQKVGVRVSGVLLGNLELQLVGGIDIYAVDELIKIDLG
jgi:hypothetical protein